MLEVLEWILFDVYHITLNLSIYPGYVRDIVMYITSLEEVCWLFLCEIVINSVMYITSVFSTCWWYFQRSSCDQLLIFCESAESKPGYGRDIVMYITYLEVRYVGGSCVNFISFLSHLSKPVDISWICAWHCYVYNEYRRQVCWWFLCEIVSNYIACLEDRYVWWFLCE